MSRVSDGFRQTSKVFNELEVGTKFTKNYLSKNTPTVEYEKIEPVNKGGFVYNAKIVRTQELCKFGHYEFVSPL